MADGIPATGGTKRAMVWRLRVICLLVIAVGSSLGGLRGQTNRCEPLRPLPGNLSQYKDRGNRCEGLYVADVGSRSVELVSLTLGVISYEMRPGVKLQVSAPGQNAAVHIRAVAKPAGTHYRMDALLAPGSVLLWPVDDVLLRESINASRLGVFGWKEGGADKIFVPVLVTPQSPAAVAPLGEPARLCVRPSFDTQAVKWRCSQVEGGWCSTSGPWQDAAGGSVDAGQPVEISLRALTGSDCVEVAARSTTSRDWATIKLRIELPRK
jgi:hypothetical protein